MNLREQIKRELRTSSVEELSKECSTTTQIPKSPSEAKYPKPIPLWSMCPTMDPTTNYAQSSFYPFSNRPIGSWASLAIASTNPLWDPNCWPAQGANYSLCGGGPQGSPAYNAATSMNTYLWFESFYTDVVNQLGSAPSPGDVIDTTENACWGREDHCLIYEGHSNTIASGPLWHYPTFHGVAQDCDDCERCYCPPIPDTWDCVTMISWEAPLPDHKKCILRTDGSGQFSTLQNCQDNCKDDLIGILSPSDTDPLGSIDDDSVTMGESIIKHLRLLSEEKVVNFDNPNNNFVVIAGGPGAGKSFITGNLINLDNVKNFNVDNVRVLKAKELWGDKWEETISTPEGYEEILDKTYTTSDPRNLTVRFLKQFLDQERNQPTNVVYDAGGGQEKVMRDVQKLAKDAGFHTTLVYVRTPLDLAQQRNAERPRSLPTDMVAKYHDQVKDNMRNMIPLFDSVWTVDNKELIDLDNRPSDNIERIK